METFFSVYFLAVLCSCFSGFLCGYVSEFFCTEPIKVEISQPWNPFILGHRDASSTFTITVTFSRPVKVEWDSSEVEWRDRQNTRKLPPLSFVSDIRTGDGILIPYHVGNAGDSTLKIVAEFKRLSVFTQSLCLFPGPVYLVLRQSAIIGYHVLGLPITVKENYIPLTILGIFYFSEEQMVFPNVPPQIIRTDGMYCGYQRPRYLITKDGDSSSLSLILQKDNGTITISHTGHVQVHLPITLKGQGSGTFPLPNAVMATYDNQRLAVKLPSKEVDIVSTNVKIKIPLKVTTMNEQRERLYHMKPASMRSKGCPPGSTRNNIDITVYHVLEAFGGYPLYWPELDHDLWSVTEGTKMKIAVGTTANKSHWHNIDKGIEETMNIPAHIVSAVKKYAFTLPTSDHPWSMINSDPSTLLIDAVFIPRELAEARGCGTLNITEDDFFGQENFCNGKAGSCVGRPFYSPDRFPVIPPFGVSELEGEDFAVLHSTSEGEHYLMLQILPSNQHEELVIPGGTIQEPFLYQSGSEWTESLGAVDKAAFCKDVWSLESNLHLSQKELTATLKANIKNYGEGSGMTNITLRCSSRIKVYPDDGRVSLQMEPEHTSRVVFTLSGEQVISSPLAEHKCIGDISVLTHARLPWSPYGKTMPSCSLKFTTYHGAFQDPCTEPEQLLPDLDVQFHYLPRDQLDREGLKKMKSFILKDLVFIRAFSMDLLIGEKQDSLVYHLHEMTVSCENGYSILDLESILSLAAPVEDNVPSSLVYKRELTKRRFFFVFDRKDTDHSRPSQCQVIVFARRPHVSCPNTKVVLERLILLNRADQDALMLQQTSNILELIYGEQSSIVIFTLVVCAVTAAVMFCGVGSGHFILLIFRKKIPSKGGLKRARESLKEDMLMEKRKWENPTSYLEAGPDGPYYVLHDFKATEPLNCSDVKSIKIAGMLKYKDKELPIMFGHVKRVFLRTSSPEEPGDIWIQASSGMYLLMHDHVDSSYREEFEELVMPNLHTTLKHDVKRGFDDRMCTAVVDDYNLLDISDDDPISGVVDDGDMLAIMNDRDSSAILDDQDSSAIVGDRDSLTIVGDPESLVIMGDGDTLAIVADEDSSAIIDDHDLSYVMADDSSFGTDEERPLLTAGEKDTLGVAEERSEIFFSDACQHHHHSSDD